MKHFDEQCRGAVLAPARPQLNWPESPGGGPGEETQREEKLHLQLHLHLQLLHLHLQGTGAVSWLLRASRVNWGIELSSRPVELTAVGS